MIIHSAIDKINGRYHVTFNPPKLSTLEEEALQNNSAPTVNLGGSFTGSATRAGGTPVTVTFTLPARNVFLPTDFPVKQIFEVDNADVMAKVWHDTIVTRMTDAKNTMLTTAANFEGEQMITV